MATRQPRRPQTAITLITYVALVRPPRIEAFAASSRRPPGRGAAMRAREPDMNRMPGAGGITGATRGAARGVLAIAAVVAYQVGAHYAVATPGAHGLGLAMALVPPLALGFGAAARAPLRRRVWLLPLWALVAAALWIARATLARHFEWGLYLEHVSFNLAMALLFGSTLAQGRVPLCTQFAAAMSDELTPAVARYTRQITLAWTLFFVAVAALSSLLFALAPIVAWSTFANYLALPLTGAMFAAEFACRRFALPDEPRSGALDAFVAWRRYADADARANVEHAS
jgi:uncharacterized membrane protein